MRGEGRGGFGEAQHYRVTDGGQKTERARGGVDRLGQKPIVTETNGRRLGSLVPKSINFPLHSQRCGSRETSFVGATRESGVEQGGFLWARCASGDLVIIAQC